MVKFTTFLLASVALLVASTNAQVSSEPKSILAEDANMVILPFPRNATLERRATKPTHILSKKEQQSILDAHNKYRALHQAPPLTWNAKSAAFGDAWIQACQFQHSHGKHGENLAAGYKDFKSAIAGWYNEVKSYNYNNPGFSGATGHFTQVVWKSTKTVGCAKKYCSNSKWTIYICEYDPPGNIVSADNAYFKANVLPPKKK
ncbi:hypothetical protein BGZ46_000238 [Entomortierella lignicola]|nr:hypothetical protein BGZ46_000238 [Entomortierella lignicola]